MKNACILWSSLLSVDPNFFAANQLMLAKTYLRMGDKESARKWLDKLSKYPAKTDDDKNVSIFVTTGVGEGVLG